MGEVTAVFSDNYNARLFKREQIQFQESLTFFYFKSLYM